MTNNSHSAQVTKHAASLVGKLITVEPDIKDDTAKVTWWIVDEDVDPAICSLELVWGDMSGIPIDRDAPMGPVVLIKAEQHNIRSMTMFTLILGLHPEYGRVIASINTSGGFTTFKVVEVKTT